jgi:hypothetical protein
MSKYAKATAALIVAILAALAAALGVDSSRDFGDIDAQTWLIAGGTVLASGALTAWVDNVPGVAGGIIKAVIGATAAAVASLTVALDDHVVTRVEQVTALSAFVVGLAAVYQIKDAE